jgi:tRNA-dihydrouridine synthase B
MVYGFWQNLPRPIIGLAPMDGVTDAAYRFITAKYGHPAVIMTEFTSAEGIRAGAERLMDDFLYDEIERPVVAQVFGADPSAFYIAGVVASALGFDGIDINMGCPAKNVTDRGAGAALILDPPRAQAIIRETRRGTQAWANGITLQEAGVHERIIRAIEARQPHASRIELPVSVKTRLGYSTITITDWVQQLLEEAPVNISIHGRTLKQLYTGLANWEAIAEAAAIIHQAGSTTVLGNGDISSLEDAYTRVAQYGVDGALIGQAPYGTPWIFNPTSSRPSTREIALEHARLLDKYTQSRGFIRIRKHLLDYFKGEPDSREFRMQLLKVTCLEDVEKLLQ